MTLEVAAQAALENSLFQLYCEVIYRRLKNRYIGSGSTGRS
eukprot:CAMPEP_0113654942 /NCGR_PEP_ID=MMETSP0017_2-20120614/29426_1 /TAXON_ID=2856 /ORGANISM="Cylindrotheca closterium" /LENGTH=40 /DNA_ID=CAMNT_0000568125 /DNA_START=188 /DNA_END=310 /DNA_ORIENTATION=+ /assembly_acc=CAM_ASM_000147